MNDLVWVAFITGLTTGGISCMAVQGGLLTSSLASQIETGLSGVRKGSKRVQVIPANTPQLALPILWFVLAKLAAYTLLGFALGALGSVLDLNATSRGILQIANDNGLSVNATVVKLASDGCSPPDIDPTTAWPVINNFTTAQLYYTLGLDTTPIGLGDGVQAKFPGVTVEYQQAG